MILIWSFLPPMSDANINFPHPRGISESVRGFVRNRVPPRHLGGYGVLALRTLAVLSSAVLVLSQFGGVAPAATLYWDTDGSTSGNNASTGANLGGSGIWSTTDTNWWDTSLAILQPWTHGSDAVFWGATGAVTLSTVSANSITFKITGYSA